MKYHTKQKLLILMCLILMCNMLTECPDKCTCKKLNQRQNLQAIRLRCGGEEYNKIIQLEEIQLNNLTSEMVHLNLSNNLLSVFHLKESLLSVQKLDLSSNRLTELENDQFAKVPNLRRLDLSGNNIKTIALGAFSNLTNLEKLKLNNNEIESIELGTFDPLISLKQIDISTNPLNCNCALLWLVDWSQKKLVKLVSNLTCKTSGSKPVPLRKMKLDAKCEPPPAPARPPVEMRPAEDQVVFEGDGLDLRCEAPAPRAPSAIEWSWLGSDPSGYFADLTVEAGAAGERVASVLRIPRLSRNHTGIWGCRLAAGHAEKMQTNYSKAITIVVISEGTRYCPMTTTRNNKGAYAWPRTIVNHTAVVACEALNEGLDLDVQKASYFCNADEQWAELNTTRCAYVAASTKILEQFSKVEARVAESAKHFRNYTLDAAHFRDGMDLVFAVETMANYLRLAAAEAGDVLRDVVNNLLNLPKGYLHRAIYHYGVGGRLLELIEKLTVNSTTQVLHKPNIYAEVFHIKKHGFSGLKCTRFRNFKISNEKLFNCVAGSPDITEISEQSEVAISIPETLFTQLEYYQNISEQMYDLFITIYNGNKLFPVREQDRNVYDVNSAVVGLKLMNLTVANLSDPVYIMLKTPDTSFLSTAPLIPVWSNPELNQTWTPDGCTLNHQFHDQIIFSCQHFGHYGLMQDITHVSRLQSGARFKLSHPAIYVGTCILFTSLLVAIITYILCYNAIQMPKKAKHSLINLWISVSALCFFYVFGIYQTEDVRLCQIVGIALHYLSLSSILWICVGVNCMYKRLNKNDLIDMQDDELPSDQPIKKPILGLYFVGWGVATIICGISAAINIREYSTPSYCFLRPGPPLSALYIPFTILLIHLAIFFLLIRCAIYSTDSNGQLSEGTQATENVDLDLLEPPFPPPGSVLTQSTKTTSSIEDSEHLPAAQLKAYLIFLAIYVLAWLACAFATPAPARFIPFESELFSIAFAILASILSAFTLFFYCVARSDVRSEWTRLGRWARPPVCRPRHVADARRSLEAAPSRSSSRSSGRAKSRASAEPPKANNVNLVVLHRQQYRASAIPHIIENPTSAADAFYNPHQSIVARKFFKRQKRHQLKRNNFLPRIAKDNASVDQMKFASSSKVNNSNIHVERQLGVRGGGNPNIFSDSGESGDLRLSVDFCDQLRRRGLVRRERGEGEGEMRSVSQQCTLEYSSENLSDSILERSEGEAFKSNVGRQVEAERNEGKEVARIYVNPAAGLINFEKGVVSRPSSVSVSDLDELYQQIRRGAQQRNSSRSDSDVLGKGGSNDNVETTV